MARIKYKRKMINSGKMTDKNSAALWYNKMARKYYGVFAYQNKLKK